MTNPRLPMAQQLAVRPFIGVFLAAIVFAAGSSVPVRAEQHLDSIAEKNAPATKRAPSAALRKKLGIPKTTPNPYLSYLPVESRPNPELWRERMHTIEVNRHTQRKATAQASGNFLALLPVGESEGPAVRGVNDTQATAQFVGGFGTGAGDDAAMDISGNLKTPDPVTGFTPDAEDEGDILKASDTTVGDGQAKTAPGTVGDGPYGPVTLTEVPIDPPLEDDGDIPAANVTDLLTGQVVVSEGTIGDGPFAATSGDFDVFSFSVSANETIIIEVNHPVGNTSLDPILALVNSDGDIVLLNDDGPFSIESYLNVTFTCPSGNCPTQTYYAFIGGYSGENPLTAASFPSNRSDSSTGPGAGDEGPYELRITRQITASGDFDFYSVTANEGDVLTVEVDTANFGGVLDPIVAIYDSNGNMLAFNDDDPAAPLNNFDSYLSLFAPQTGDYFIAVGGFDANVFPTSPLSFLEDPFDSSSGPGSTLVSTGNYDVIVSRNHVDLDFYSFEVEAGDIIGVNITGATPVVGLYAESGQLLIASGFPIAGSFPAASPLPGGGDAGAAYVIPESGTYAVFTGFGEGAYDLEVRAFRPSQEATGTTQRLFIDFDGASVDTTKFGADPGHPQPSILSPLADFLPAWGLTGADENAVIDAILAVVEQNLSTDIRFTGNNPAFDIEILNSRDHADPFGEPDVSRVIVGGTILESDIETIGIAESIDIGNFEQAEDSLVLLDLLSRPAGDPNSLNSFALGAASKAELIGEGVGNIVAHEAGHFFANFHTNNANLIPNLMDTGGNLPGLVGVGDDNTFGTVDDFDVNFVADEYEPSEGLAGLEDTKNAIAFGLTIGQLPTSFLFRRNDLGHWLSYEIDGFDISSKESALLTKRFVSTVAGVRDFNGDNKDDVLLRRSDTGTWQLYLMNQSSVLDFSGISFPKSFDFELLFFGDFDGNSTVDVMLRNSTTGRLFLYLMDGTTITANRSFNITQGLVWDPLTAGDFNGDGSADVLMRRPDNGRWRVHLFDGLDIIEDGVIALPTLGTWQLEKTADFDGDGATDILIRRTDIGNWRIYLMNGTQIVNSDVIGLESDTNWQLQSVADFDSDGRADILLRNSVTGRWQLYLLDGTTVIESAELTMPVNSDYQLQSVVDLNSDGNRDILLRNMTNGRWFAYQLSGTVVSESGEIDFNSKLVWDLVSPELP